MRDHRDTRSANHDSDLLKWTARLFVAVGAAMLAWSALLVTEAVISQRVARRSLETASQAERPVERPPEPRRPERSAEVPTRAPVVVTGSAIAELSIPRVQLSTVVLHGSDDRTLRRGPGHLENTALPGEPGNVVIAGHRDSFFRPLRHVRVGDDVFMATPQGRFQYRITSLNVVGPRDLSVLEPTDTATLTLITCYPFWVLGPAPDRFIVRATRVVDSTAAANAAPAAPPQKAVPAPAAQAPAARDRVVPIAHEVRDDGTLVREAIERFRIAYNGRLARYSEIPPRGLLKFQACDIAFADDHAAVICQTPPESPDDLEPPVWILAFDRADEGWAIKSVYSR